MSKKRGIILTGVSELKTARLRSCDFTCQSFRRNCSTLSFDLFNCVPPEVFWFDAYAHRLEFFSSGMPVIPVQLGSFLWYQGVGLIFSEGRVSSQARRVLKKLIVNGLPTLNWRLERLEYVHVLPEC